jgi:hypothetical protein
VLLVETEACGKVEIGTHADEHAAPVAIVEVEVVLHNPALCQLQVPTVVLLFSDGDQNPCRFSCFQNDDDLVRWGVAKVGFHKLVASTFRSFQDGDVPFLRSVLHPVLKLLGDVSQHIPANGVLISIGAEESHNPFRLLKGLYETVEKNPVKAAIPETNAILCDARRRCS